MGKSLALSWVVFVTLLFFQLHIYFRFLIYTCGMLSIGLKIKYKDRKDLAILQVNEKEPRRKVRNGR